MRLFSRQAMSLAAMFLAATGCYDTVGPIGAHSAGVAARLRFDGMGSPPSPFSDVLSIGANTFIVLPSFSYSTWVTFSVTGPITLHSLTGSRTTLNGAFYTSGVWSQDSNCGLRVSIIYSAAGIDDKQTCDNGATSFTDTIPVKSFGTAQRGPFPLEMTGACGAGVECHWVTGSPQSVTLNVLPVTLNKLTVSPALINFAAVSYFPVQFTASRTPAQMTIHGNVTGMPMTTTAWIFKAVDSTDEQIWAYCPFPGYTTPTCTPNLHRAGRMTVKAFAGGWEQTSSAAVQCPLLPWPGYAGPQDSALNDAANDFATRTALLAALDSGNVNLPADSGFAPGSNKGYRIEHGGTIYKVPGSPDFFIPTFNVDTAATMCHFTPNGGNYPGQGSEYAVFHVHTSDKGGPLFGCQGKDSLTNLPYQQYPGGPGLPVTADPDKVGGGSTGDWKFADENLVPVYVITKKGGVARLDPGYPNGNLQNQRRWDAFGASSPKCRWAK